MIWYSGTSITQPDQGGYAEYKCADFVSVYFLGRNFNEYTQYRNSKRRGRQGNKGGRDGVHIGHVLWWQICVSVCVYSNTTKRTDICYCITVVQLNFIVAAFL